MWWCDICQVGNDVTIESLCFWLGGDPFLTVAGFGWADGEFPLP